MSDCWVWYLVLWGPLLVSLIDCHFGRKHFLHSASWVSVITTLGFPPPGIACTTYHQPEVRLGIWRCFFLDFPLPHQRFPRTCYVKDGDGPLLLEVNHHILASLLQFCIYLLIIIIIMMHVVRFPANITERLENSKTKCLALTTLTCWCWYRYVRPILHLCPLFNVCLYFIQNIFNPNSGPVLFTRWSLSERFGGVGTWYCLRLQGFI